jgi:hypothetical protein
MEFKTDRILPPLPVTIVPPAHKRLNTRMVFVRQTASEPTLERAVASAQRRAQLEKRAFAIIEQDLGAAGKRYRVQPDDWQMPVGGQWTKVQTVAPPEKTNGQVD